MEEETIRRRARVRAAAGALSLVLLASTLHLTCWWRGPTWLDGLLYADAALLDRPEPTLALRYGFIYEIAGLGRLCGSMATGAGLAALLSHLGLILFAYYVGYSRRGFLGALAAGIGMALFPLVLEAATIPYCDTPATLFAGLAILAAAAGVRRGSWLLLAASGASLALAMRTKETAVCAVVGIVVILLGGSSATRKKHGAWFVLGGAVTWGALMVLDLVIMGDALWAMSRGTAQTYFEFNLREHGTESQQWVLTDHLLTRWMVPFALLAMAGVLSRTRRTLLEKALIAWSIASALFLAWSLCVVDFGSNERYLLPVLVPLLPLGCIWLVDRLKGLRHGIACPSLGPGLCALALGLAVVAGVAISHAFVRKAFNQALPVFWIVVVLSALAGRTTQWKRVALAVLVLLTSLASIYSATQIGRHAGREYHVWTDLVATVAAEGPADVTVAVPFEHVIRSKLRVFSSGKIAEFAPFTSSPGPRRQLLIALPDAVPDRQREGFRLLGEFSAGISPKLVAVLVRDPR